MDLLGIVCGGVGGAVLMGVIGPSMLVEHEVNKLAKKFRRQV